MSVKRVAVVTGANKGIGLQVVKELCAKYEGDVYLTSRNNDRGKTAVAECENCTGFEKLHYHQLDITDAKSVAEFRDFIKQTHGGIDCLVNNAGFAFKSAAKEPFGVQAEVTIGINYYGTLLTCNELFPLLRDGARVVNVSSSAGWLAQIKKRELKQRFIAENLSFDDISKLMEEFKLQAKNGTHREAGWPNSTYCASKIGVSAMSRVQQRIFDAEGKNKVVNHVHPGYVNTDMSSHRGPKTVKEGSEAIVMCALLPTDTEIRGQYVWDDCSLRDWVDARNSL